MNKDDEERKLGEELREIVLRELAAQFPIGIYDYAKVAAREYKAKPPKKGYFSNVVFRLADVVAKNEPLTISERIFISRLLHALSEGFDVREPLRIDARKVGHKPSQAILNAAIVRELAQRFPDDRPTGEAFAEVAQITGKSADAVRKIWERRSGQ
jgi:hypothetical protein